MRWLLFVGALVAFYAGYVYMNHPNVKFVPGSLVNKRVLVTGASGGIGEQMAYHYCRLGARLVITARREAAMQKVIERCREVGSKDGDYHYIKGDMSDMAQTKMVVEAASEKLGGLDFLVLNHVYDIRFDKWTGSEANLTGFDLTMDINVKAYVHLTSHALPILAQSAGSVVAVSAGWGRVAPPWALAYTTSKFGLEGFFHGLRQELVLRDIPVTVTVCVLGLIGTEMANEKSDDMEAKYAFTPGHPTDTALAIVKAGATKVNEMFYPFMPMWPVSTFRDFMTPILEWHWSRVLRPVTIKATAGY